MDSKWDPCNIPACIYHRNQPNAGKYTIIWILYKEVVPSFLKSGVSFLKHCCNGSNLKVYQTCQLQPIKQAVVSSSKFHWHHFVHMFCAKQKTSWQMVPSLKQPSEPPWWSCITFVSSMFALVHFRKDSNKWVPRSQSFGDWQGPRKNGPWPWYTQSQSIFEKTHQVITYNNAATITSAASNSHPFLFCSPPPLSPPKNLQTGNETFGAPSIYASTMGYIIIAPAEALKQCNLDDCISMDFHFHPWSLRGSGSPI